jgi:hypothetical protein
VGLNEHGEHTDPSRRADARRGADMSLLLVLVLLLPLTALCLRASMPSRADAAVDGPLGGHVDALAGGSFVLLGGMAWWFAKRMDRRRDWNPGRRTTPGTRADTAIGASLLVATVFVPLSLLIFGGRGSKPREATPLPSAPAGGRPLPTTTVPPPKQNAHHPYHPSGLFHVLLIVAIVLAAAAVLVLAVWLVGRLLGWWGTFGAATLPATLREDDEALSDAVDAAAGALLDGTDVRAAIIACYAAMEASLRDAGVPRLAADSPEQLLARAAGGGAIDTPAAAELTRLFGEARFSTHALTERHRESAQAALTTIRTNLRERAAAAAAVWEAAR